MPESRARIDNIEDGPDYLIEPKGKEVLKKKKKKRTLTLWDMSEMHRCQLCTEGLLNGQRTICATKEVNWYWIIAQSIKKIHESKQI